MAHRTFDCESSELAVVCSDAFQEAVVREKSKDAPKSDDKRAIEASVNRNYSTEAYDSPP
jgi:hypothetical protein